MIKTDKSKPPLVVPNPEDIPSPSGVIPEHARASAFIFQLSAALKEEVTSGKMTRQQADEILAERKNMIAQTQKHQDPNANSR